MKDIINALIEMDTDKYFISAVVAVIIAFMLCMLFSATPDSVIRDRCIKYGEVILADARIKCIVEK